MSVQIIIKKTDVWFIALCGVIVAFMLLVLLTVTIMITELITHNQNPNTLKPNNKTHEKELHLQAITKTLSL